MPYLPGETLNKRYRIVHLLGEGPYGTVYRAWDLIDHRNVAVKEYLDASPETQRLFRAEASRLSALKHPQLPEIRDHFILEETGQYLISDFVDGTDLQNLLEQYGPLPSDLIIGWLQAVCTPLTAIHKAGQLHLNMKPANIRLTPDGRVFLVDTGLPGLGISVGVSGYSAPEQQTQGAVTIASDIYSLGATLYSLLTNKTPPDALHRESGLEVLTPAREVNPDVEPYLSVVASRAMDLRPDVRFESVKEFAKALERPIGRPVFESGAPRRTAPRRSAMPPRRLPKQQRKQIEQRTIFGLAAALVLFVGIALGLILASRGPEIQEEQKVATATFQSHVVAALTAITTVTPTPAPSPTPIPTPAPLIDERTGALMIYVPGGIFRMGDDDGEPDESPSRLVRLDPYFIDQTEVTNSQYQMCVEEDECEAPFSSDASYHPAYYGASAFDDYPVIFVTWYNAQDFCRWRGARLPSEAEWERAAGFDPYQGLKFTFPWGDTFNGTVLNYCDVNCPRDDRDLAFDDGHVDTAPVGSFPGGRSPLGIYDSSGNVMEWVSDWYDADYYTYATDKNPLGPLDGEAKSLRGGSWLSEGEGVRISGRSSFIPTVFRANLGFRCAMPAP